MEIVDNKDKYICDSDFEYTENDCNDITADYIIVCEDKLNFNPRKPIYDYLIAGISLVNWVSMACETKPTYIIDSNCGNVLSLVKPYLKKSEYTIVLYANTPLVVKTHLRDLLGFVSRKRLNVCKLPKGYILKNDFVMNIDEIYSNTIYDLSTNDFFEVNNYNDIDKIKSILEKRIFNYHKKNGVIFENQNNTTIDADVKIGFDTKISNGVSLLKNCVIGKNVFIGGNCSVTGSKIGDDVTIEAGVIIENSIIKNGSVIQANSLLKHSIVNENSTISVGVNLVDTAIQSGSKIENFVTLSNVNVLENAVIGQCSKIIGISDTVAVERNSTINAGVCIIKND